MKKIFIASCLALLTLTSYSQWVLTSSGNGFDIFSMSFPSASTGYVCGYGNFLHKTTNGGADWIDLSLPTTAQNLNAIFFTSDNTGWMCSTNYNLMKTTNGGVNWTVNYNPIYGNEIQFINSQTGWAGGSNIIIKTTNAGANWTAINISTTGTLYFVDAMTGWMVSYTSGSSTINKTTDGGFNWTPQVSTTDFANIYDLKFLNQNTGWAAGYREVILKTTNGGANWIEQRNVAGSPGLYAIGFIDANTGWIVGDASGSGSRMLSTTNGGTTWNQNFQGNGRLTCIQFVNSSTGYIAGQYNNVYKTTNLGGLTGITPVGNNLPSSFRLYQNYPNPFNPSTKINFSIPETQKVMLYVYDVSGKRLEILIDNYFNAGTYSVDWDAAGYSTGIYFYTLTAGEFKETEKMILVK